MWHRLLPVAVASTASCLFCVLHDLCGVFVSCDLHKCNLANSVISLL